MSVVDIYGFVSFLLTGVGVMLFYSIVLLLASSEEFCVRCKISLDLFMRVIDVAWCGALLDGSSLARDTSTADD